MTDAQSHTALILAAGLGTRMRSRTCKVLHPVAGAPEARVRATNLSFTPSEIRLPKERAVILTLVNPASSGVAHDLTVPALGIRIVANAGETTVGSLELRAGRFSAYCSVPGHAEAGMRATVIVE